MVGSIRNQSTGIETTDIARDSSSAWVARTSAWAFSRLPRHLAIAVDAPTPIAVPTPPTIQ